MLRADAESSCRAVAFYKLQGFTSEYRFVQTCEERNKSDGIYRTGSDCLQNFNYPFITAVMAAFAVCVSAPALTLEHAHTRERARMRGTPIAQL